jgi:hypothetical protein
LICHWFKLRIFNIFDDDEKWSRKIFLKFLYAQILLRFHRKVDFYTKLQNSIIGMTSFGHGRNSTLLFCSNFFEKTQHNGWKVSNLQSGHKKSNFVHQKDELVMIWSNIREWFSCNSSHVGMNFLHSFMPELPHC